VNRTSRALFVNAVLLGLVGLVALFVFGRSGSRASPPYGALLLPLDAFPLERIELARDGRVVTVERRPWLGPREYRQLGDVERPAELSTIDVLGRALCSESALVRDVTEAHLSLEGLGLRPPSFRLSLTQGAVRRTLELGGPAPSPAGSRYARYTEGDEPSRLLVLAPEVSTSLDLEPEALLDTRLVPALPSELASIEIGSDTAGQRLVRAPDTGHWYLEQSPPIRADRSRLSPWLLQLTTLRATRLSSNAPALPSPERARLKLRLRETAERPPRTLTLDLQFAPDAAQATVVLEGDAPRAFAQISGAAARALARLPEPLEDVRLLFATPDEIERVTWVAEARRLTLSRRSTSMVFSGSHEREVQLSRGNPLFSQLWSLSGELGTGQCDADSPEYRDAARLELQAVGVGLADSTAETLVLAAREDDGTRLVCRLDDGLSIKLAAADAEVLENFLQELESLEEAEEALSP